MKKSYLTLYLLFAFYTLISAQSYTISGYIEDLKTGEMLIGANVFDESSDKGTITNTYGFYSLTLPKSDNIQLNVSYIGYASQIIPINHIKNSQLNFKLDPSVSLDEIEVVASEIKRIEEETQMSVIDVPIAQIKKIPPLLGEVDVLKALQLLPGVQSGGEGQNGLYVRGGSPDQNLILLDGVPVYNASHLFGFFSVFNADAIKDVKLIKGGFPARYGGRLSSVLEINMKEGNTKELHGAGSIGLVASKLTLEGPILSDKTSFLVSGRRTYIDVLARPFIKKAFEDDDQKGSAGYYFYDLNAKVNHKFSDKDRLYLSMYTGKDKFYTTIGENEIPSEYNRNNLGWGNLTSALRWNHLLTEKLFANTTLTFSRYKLNTDLSFGTDYNDKNIVEEVGLNYFSGIDDLAAKVDFDFVPNPDHFIRFGASAINHKFKPGKFLLQNINTRDNINFRDTIGQDNIKAWEFGSYIEDDWAISKKLKINAGLHFSVFNVNQKNYYSLQPRLSTRYLLPNGIGLKASFATMRQYINLLSFDGIGLPTDLWLPTTRQIKPQDSWQAAIGGAKTFNQKYEISIEMFYKQMKNLISYKDGQGLFQADDWQNRVTQGDGEAYGAEFFVQKKKGKFNGWVGYTLSWNWRTYDELNNGIRFPYRFDRRHDISIVGSYKFNKRVNIGATWVYGTGNAVTLPNSKYNALEEFQGYHNLTQIDHYDKRNDFRMRSYHRLDLGINFVKKKKRHTRTWSFGAYNAYANNNPFFLYLDDKQNKISDTVYEEETLIKQVTLFPLIPYFNYSFEF